MHKELGADDKSLGARQAAGINRRPDIWSNFFQHLGRGCNKIEPEVVNHARAGKAGPARLQQIVQNGRVPGFD